MKGDTNATSWRVSLTFYRTFYCLKVTNDLHISNSMYYGRNAQLKIGLTMLNINRLTKVDLLREGRNMKH